MKKLLLFVAMLCFCSTNVFALKVINNTHCDITVTIDCYDLCVLVGTQSANIHGNGGSAAFIPCITHDFAIATICWTNSGVCQWPPTKQCVRIDASSPAAPSPCSPGTYTGQIIWCSACALNGIATASYNPITDEIRIQ